MYEGSPIADTAEKLFPNAIIVRSDDPRKFFLEDKADGFIENNISVQFLLKERKDLVIFDKPLLRDVIGYYVNWKQDKIGVDLIELFDEWLSDPKTRNRILIPLFKKHGIPYVQI